MKAKRHRAILDLIEKHPIYKQEVLLDYLREKGFEATQATISRDIRELHLVKTTDDNGIYRYLVSSRSDAPDRFSLIFRESVSDIDHAGNIVMVKCFTGMANAACELFDNESDQWGEIVGTLSGDNTFIVLTRTENDAHQLAGKLKEYLF